MVVLVRAAMTLLLKVVETVVQHKNIKPIPVEKTCNVGPFVLKGQRGVSATRAEQYGRTIGGIRGCFKIFNQRRLLVAVQAIDGHFLTRWIKEDFFLRLDTKAVQAAQNKQDCSHSRF